MQLVIGKTCAIRHLFMLGSLVNKTHYFSRSQIELIVHNASIIKYPRSSGLADRLIGV